MHVADNGARQSMNSSSDQITLQLRFMWVPRVLGGHSGPPWLGMRSMIRWQQPDAARDRISRDAQCLTLEYDSATHMGAGTFRLISEIDPKWLEPGHPIVLMHAYRVMAVGITAARAA